MDLYAENILDHYKSPRHKGILPTPTVTHQEKNLSCGDDLTIELAIVSGRITDLRWTGQGCAISQAAMSMLSEELIGKRTTEASTLSPSDVLKLLRVPIGPRRKKCAFLCLHTLKNTLRKIEGQDAAPWTETVLVHEED